MKQLFFSLVLTVAAITSFGQSEKFTKGMEKNLAQLDSAKTPEQLNAVAASFERIGDAEKTQWLPYYYAALANIWKGFSSKDNKDEIATTAEALIAKAEAIEKNNAELYILKNMAATMHMLVDPQARWMQYGPIAGEALGKAKAIDPNNPRVYYLEGQSLFGTPEQFGGGKDKAKPVFEKSLTLFNTYKPASSLHPTWGKSNAQKMLEQCK